MGYYRPGSSATERYDLAMRNFFVDDRCSGEEKVGGGSVREIGER
jgi:hypothetical protein